MTIKNLISLAKAGFSENEIERIVNVLSVKNSDPSTDIVTDSATNPVPNTITATNPVPNTVTATNPDPGASTPNISDVLTAINTLTDRIGATSVLRSNQPHMETADEILAKIINP